MCMDSYGTGQEAVVGSFVHGNKLLRSTKRMEFFIDQEIILPKQNVNNTAHPDGSLYVEKINASFALRIKKVPTKEAVKQRLEHYGGPSCDGLSGYVLCEVRTVKDEIIVRKVKGKI